MCDIVILPLTGVLFLLHKIGTNLKIKGGKLVQNSKEVP